jgi:hypothetical protein
MAYGLLESLGRGELGLGYEGDDQTVAAGPAGSSGSVQVVLCRGR